MIPLAYATESELGLEGDKGGALIVSPFENPCRCSSEVPRQQWNRQPLASENPRNTNGKWLMPHFMHERLIAVNCSSELFVFIDTVCLDYYHSQLQQNIFNVLCRAV